MYRDNKNNEILQDVRMELQSRLEQASASGIRLYVDGCEATPYEVASRCVREDCAYMPDYILDEKGQVEQLRFDRVENG